MVKAAAKGSSGGGIANGRYHAIVDSVESRDEDVVVKFKIIGGDHEQEIGKHHTEYFGLGERAISRFWTLCCACGVPAEINGETGPFTRDRWKEADNAGHEIEVNEADLEGMQCVIGCKEEESKKRDEKGNLQPTGKFYPRVNYDIWGVFDAKVADVPKDSEAISCLDPPGETDAHSDSVKPVKPSGPKPGNGSGEKKDWTKKF